MAGHGQGGEHDGQVRLDRIVVMAEHGPGAQVGLGHAERLPETAPHTTLACSAASTRYLTCASQAGVRRYLAVSDGIQVLDAWLLLRVARIRRRLPGLYPLGDAFLAEQRTQPLVADVIDHPLSDHELRQLGQAPRRERQIMLRWPGLGDLLHLAPLEQVNFQRARAAVLRIQGTEPVGAKVPDHIPDPVLTGERHPGDRRRVHALG